MVNTEKQTVSRSDGLDCTLYIPLFSLLMLDIVNFFISHSRSPLLIGACGHTEEKTIFICILSTT